MKDLNLQNSGWTEYESEEDVLVSEERERALVLYNDDVNTFDHVIESLVAVCKHTMEQAEQCSYLVHYKGKCAVKHGSTERLKPLKSALQECKLTVKIQ